MNKQEENDLPGMMALKLQDNGAKKPLNSQAAALLFIMAFSSFAFLFNLGGRSLENKDYIKYAEIGREMIEGNDWIIPRENEKIYVQKPPLHFWNIAIAYKLFGVNPFSARMPAVVFALGGILLAYFAGRKLFGSIEIGFLSACALLSSFGYFWWARRTRLDMEFSTFLSLSIFLFYLGCNTESRKKKILLYMGFWLVSGFGFLEKAHFIFMNLVVVIPYIIIRARRTGGPRVSPLAFILSSPIFLLPVLPWVLLLVSHPTFHEYWHALMNTKIMGRSEGLFYYIPEVAAKLVPSTPFLFLAAWGYLRYRKTLPERRGIEFALLWILPYFFILNLTVVKNQRYLLPIFIPCSVLTAWSISFFERNKYRGFQIALKWYDRLLLAGAAGTLFVPAIGAIYYGKGLIAPLVYGAILAVVLFVARRFVPVKPARIFISFTILLLAIETNDAVRNSKVSYYLRITENLKMHNLTAEEIAFNRCKPRIREAVSFYYNKLIRRDENLASLLEDPGIKGIVIPEETAKKEKSTGGLKKRQELLPLPEELVLVLKPSGD